jgi:hypothetical protein|tara:strand:+ start:31236 stop:31889 length:654 start_codon:yes stop_codon:yes gene_type:complete
MPLTVTVPAVNSELTSLIRIKGELEITASTDDPQLVDNIREASALIKAYCGRDFARETVTETFVGSGMVDVCLTRTPIISVSALSYDGTTIGSTTFEIQDSEAGILRRIDNIWTNSEYRRQNIERYALPSGAGKNNWSVTYVSGYITPGSTSGQRTLPFDIERACIETVKSFYLRRGDDPRLKHQRTGDASETLFDTVHGLPATAESILRNWRRISI